MIYIRKNEAKGGVDEQGVQQCPKKAQDGRLVTLSQLLEHELLEKTAEFEDRFDSI